MSDRHSPDSRLRVVSESVRGLHRILHTCDLFSRKTLREFGVSGLQIWGLRTVVDAECTTMDELVHRLHLSPSTVSSLVDRLEARDLASRRRASEDSQTTELRLTAAGRRLVFEVPEPPHSKVSRGIEALSSEDLDCVHRAVEILGHILDVPGPVDQDPSKNNDACE
jgi:DNA-binding MarR family transcriptional regulator